MSIPRLTAGMEPDCIDYAPGAAVQKYRPVYRLVEFVRGCRVSVFGRTLDEATARLEELKAKMGASHD